MRIVIEPTGEDKGEAVVIEGASAAVVAALTPEGLAIMPNGSLAACQALCTAVGEDLASKRRQFDTTAAMQQHTKWLHDQAVAHQLNQSLKSGPGRLWEGSAASPRGIEGLRD